MEKLKKFKGIYFFKKEAASLRGYPDIIGCLNGLFFGLEVKKSKSEAVLQTGRSQLQKYQLESINNAGGYATMIYPENEKEVLAELKKRGDIRPLNTQLNLNQSS
jgi:hypothetical protein